MTRVVLLQEATLPDTPEFCCWRHAVRGAFAAGGATVSTVSVNAGSPAGATAGRRDPAALVRRAVRVPLRRLRHRPGRSPGRTVRRRILTPSPPAELGTADLVLAWSFDAATLAARTGTPRQALWVLAVPPERLVAGDPGAYAARLAAVAPLVGGFLATDEPARESIERALSVTRTRVELLPRGCDDPPCPACARSSPRAPGKRVPQAPGQRLPADAPPVRAAGAYGVAAGGPSDGSRSVRDRAVRRLIDDALPAATSSAAAARPRSVLLTGFDLKFAAALAERLDRRGDLEVTVDEWPHLNRGTAHSGRLARRADAIFAEWVRPSTAWLSRRKRPHQFLVTRLHRYELEATYPRDVLIDNVDAVVYIAPLLGRRIRSELGWPAGKLVHIPNYVDVDSLDRPKLPGARFALGMVGMDTARKRFDRALDILAALRREDPRFTLVVRSAMPWRNRYLWHKAAEREFAARCFERLDNDPMLRHAVMFDPPGADMARWYRRVGFILSCSDAEGSHLAVAEGMASGAVPVVRSWAGADELYHPGWIVDSVDAAAEAVWDRHDPDRWSQAAQRARAEVRRSHNPAAVVPAWATLLQGDLDGARRLVAERITAPAPRGSPSSPHEEALP